MCFDAAYGETYGDANEAGQRRGVHDVALVLGDQPGHERAEAMDHAHQVDAEHPLPFAVGLIPARPDVTRDPRVVADDVHRAEPFPSCARERVDGTGIGDIRRDAQHLGPGGLMLRDRAFERDGIDVGEDQSHPLGGEASRQRRADPSGPARDHRDLPVQLLHAHSVRGTASTDDPTGVSGRVISDSYGIASSGLSQR